MTTSTTPPESPTFTIVRLDHPMDASTFEALLQADPQVALQVLPVRGQDDAVRSALASAQAYHITSARDDLPAHWFANEALLQACPSLLVVSTYGAGYDTVDLDACTRAGVCVVNQSGSNARAVAEHALAMMLGLAKRITENDRRLRRGDKFARHEAMGFELQGRTLGLVGIGHTGGQMARLGAAMDMKVIACDPLLSSEEIARRGAQAVTLPELLAQADVVSVHCPRDHSTLGMFNARTFAAMKKGALFVSTARGGIHEETALYDALVCGHLGGAGLDVWMVEPPEPTHPLLKLDHVVASYHTAGVSLDARRQMASMAATQLLGIAHGQRPPRLINPQVWPVFARRYREVMGRGIE